MNLRVYGTYRHRVRVNFIFFWYVERWKTDNFDQTLILPEVEDKTVYSNGVISVSASVKGRRVTAKVAYTGVTIIERSLDIPLGSAKFHAEPIKGCVIDGTATLGE